MSDRRRSCWRSRASRASDRFSTSFGDGVDRARQAAQQAGDVAVARVHVRRDLLQEHDEQALEADQLGERVAQTVSVLSIEPASRARTGTLRLSDRRARR